MSAKDNWLANLRHIVDAMPAKSRREAYSMVAEASGLGVEYIYQLYEGKPRADGKARYPGNAAVAAIRKAFGAGKPENWIDLPPDAPLNRLKIQAEDEIIVNQFDTGGSMGTGLILRDQPGVIKKMVFNREWLGKNIKHFTHESNLCLVTGFGDSMRGMYNSGDPLIVDKGVNSVEFDGVYFFRVGDEGFIKRLQRVPGEGLIAISENKAYRDWTINGNMDFEVFGRVLRAWHSEDY